VKILYWAEAFWPTIGGVEVLSGHLVSALRERGHEFVVVTDHRGCNISDTLDYNGVPVYRFHFQRLLENRDVGGIAATRRNIALLKKSFAPDIIHINACGPGLFFHLSTAAEIPVKTLCTIHALLTHSGGRDTVMGQMLRQADWVTAVSRTMLNDVRRILPEVSQRSSVIYNSLSMPGARPEPLPFDSPRLLCIGRVVTEKGFDLALRAFTSIVQSYPQCRMIIAGDGPALSGLRGLADELGLTDSVEFSGWVEPEEIPGLINKATVVVIPSRKRESFGLVALQAAQMGRPVVATNVGGLPEVIVKGETGLLVGENSHELSAAIAALLMNPDFAVRMGRSAQERAAKFFSWDLFVEAYDSLYRNITQGHNES